MMIYLVLKNHVTEGCQKVFMKRKGKNHQIEIVPYENQNNFASLWGVFGTIFYSPSRQPGTVRKKHLTVSAIYLRSVKPC